VKVPNREDVKKNVRRGENKDKPTEWNIHGTQTRTEKAVS
jgi:hypothetical protein